MLATRGNLNTDIGVPLTLLGLRSAHRYCAIELGMNHPGEIAALAAIAQADRSRWSTMRSASTWSSCAAVEAVARRERERVRRAAARRTAVVNADDPHAGFFRSRAAGHRTRAISASSARPP